MKNLIIITLLFAATSVQAVDLDSLYKDDVSSIEKLCDAMLQAFSGKASEQKDWTRFENLFLTLSQQINVAGGDEPYVNVESMAAFMEEEKPWYDKTDFSEWAIKYTIREFGNMASVIQTFGYEYNTPSDDDAAIGAGFTAFQLIYLEERWWIVSLIWEGETEKNKIAEQYMK
ncbi:MAG: hypothetical protein HRT71_12390 [Flavobacteriales bacterium]|nr:hypothetical protein [Flavobacteriales bacterium]